MPLSQWIYPRPDPDGTRMLQKELGLPAVVAGILAGRGVTGREAALLLGPQPLDDPMALPDMDKAVARIEKAIEDGEHIAVYGDYDCDGVTATAILYSYLQSMGAAVSYYIPDRLDEGFGMNMGAVDTLAKRGVKLIITVDNGTAALPEIDYASSLGIDVVVTDHHQPGDRLPDCAAVVNPHRREYEGFKQLCGAGVALKLCAALEGGSYETVLEDFAPLAAIGTIGDVVPLVSENRTIVEEGLRQLPMTGLPGLHALLTAAGLGEGELTASRVAFGICPRLNAAGRMGESALSERLLLCEDEEEAAELAEKLCGLNQARRDQEEKILETISACLSEDPSLLLDRVLVLSAPDLGHGVVGIVASRMVELYGKPCFVISEEGELAVGSGRSLGEFSLFQAVSACSSLLEKFGGHKLAAGLTLRTENIPAFRQMLNAYAARMSDRMPVPRRVIDKVLRGSELTLETVESLSALEPFGEGNPQPLFLMKNCLIEGITPLSGGKHLKLRVNFDGKSVFVLCFRMTPDEFVYPSGSWVDLLVHLEVNTFRGNKSISVRMQDIRVSGFEEKKCLSAEYYYGKLRRGEPVDRRIAAQGLPDIRELRGLYKMLRGLKAPAGADAWYMGAAAEKMNYCKYRVSLDIFREMGLISLSPDLRRMEVLPVEGKVDMETSSVLASVRKMAGG